MVRCSIISVAFLVITASLQARGASKYTNETRPYEFGFTIEGEQHRHEKKDENGIIMGEYGFITADGVYHVTVYATDENGGFRILSMKNIRTKPYPTTGVLKQAQPRNLRLPSELQATSSLVTTSKPQSQPLPIVPSAQSGKSCSHCSLPATTTKAPPPLFNMNPTYYQQVPVSPSHTQSSYPGISIQNNPNSILNFPTQEKMMMQSYPSVGQRSNFEDLDQYQSQQTYEPDVPNINMQPIYSEQNPNTQNYPTFGSNFYTNNEPQIEEYNNAGVQNAQAQNYPEQKMEDLDVLQPPLLITFGTRTPKQFDIARNLNNDDPKYSQNIGDSERNEAVQIFSEIEPTKPVLTSVLMRIVPKDTDIYHKEAGETDGLPRGITEDYMSRLLYTFNYTVGFHGHHEEGYINGAKVGYYYVTGRNGIRTRVDYVADENGFRPKITQEVLDLLSDEVPKPETEKDEKYGLKSYEFKWLYFPVESKES